MLSITVQIEVIFTGPLRPGGRSRPLLTAADSSLGNYSPTDITALSFNSASIVKWIDYLTTDQAPIIR